jgi:hypothetical protein
MNNRQLKRIFWALLICTFFLGSCASYQPENTQAESGDGDLSFPVLTVQDYLLRSFTCLTQIYNNTSTTEGKHSIDKFGFPREGALWGFMINKNTSVSGVLSGEAGNTLFIMAGAHDGGAKLSLKLFAGNKPGADPVASDQTPDQAKCIRTILPVSGDYSFTLENKSEKPAFVCMLALQKDRDAKAATFNILPVLDAADLIINKSASSHARRIPFNQQVIFGDMLSAGASTGYSNAEPLADNALASYSYIYVPSQKLILNGERRPDSPLPPFSPVFTTGRRIGDFAPYYIHAQPQEHKYGLLATSPAEVLQQAGYDKSGGNILGSKSLLFMIKAPFYYTLKVRNDQDKETFAVGFLYEAFPAAP